MKAYLLNLAIGFDQFCNTIIGGSSDITISASAGYAKRNGKVWGCVLCRLLGFIEKDHCEKAITSDVQRMELAEGYLGGEPHEFHVPSKPVQPSRSRRKAPKI